MGRGPGGRLLLLTAVVLAAAYQLTLPERVEFGSSLVSGLVARGLYPSEGDYRWTSGHATVVLPGPGAGRRVSIVAGVSAWRPRGTPAPPLRMSAEDGAVSAAPAAAPAPLVVVATTRRPWSGAIEVVFDSPTFLPGPGDPRPLGVRLHAITVSPVGGVFAPGLPPVLPMLWALVCVQLVVWIALAAGRPPDAARRAGAVAAVAIVLVVVFARTWTILWPAIVVAEAIALVVAVVAPGRVEALAFVHGQAARRLAAALRALPAQAVAALVLLAAAGTITAYRTRPVIEIPMGGGRETAFEQGLGSFDSLEGARFRHVPARASMDLRDFGSGPWRVLVTAATAGERREVPLLDLGGGMVTATLGPEWSVHEASGVAAPGWRSGLTLAFAGSRRDEVWLRAIRIERGGAWPPLRMVAAVAGVGLLLAIALLASGVGVQAATVTAALAIVLASAALAVDPVAMVPDLPSLVAVVLTGALLTALAAAVGDRAGTRLPPAAIAAGGIAFMAWLATTTAPLYRGGHFVFHSSIAEEIWKGRFLLYYLPYPGSMLSQQAQWGNVVVPHPSLYHTLVAPLAALPRPAFFTAEKALLALLLASMVWATAALAARLGGPEATVPAAVLMASMPAAYQLLGLGHLMTILGCWAMAMAVAYLVGHLDHLTERGPWWRAVLLLALCFLAYTAGLLFMGLVVAITAVAVGRDRPALAGALLGAAATAAAIAFLLYYVNWTWPFLSESVPRLFTGSGAHSSASAGALPFRVAAAPHKLAYTFGSALVPLLGLGGLLFARRGAERVMLLAWAAVLPLFMALDLVFNFLLKHHYFTMVPVAVGGGVLLGRLSARGRWGRALAVAALVAVAVMGARVGLDAATGRIP